MASCCCCRLARKNLLRNYSVVLRIWRACTKTGPATNVKLLGFSVAGDGRSFSGTILMRYLSSQVWPLIIGTANSPAFSLIQRTVMDFLVIPCSKAVNFSDKENLYRRILQG